MQSLHKNQYGTPIVLQIFDTYALEQLDLTGATVSFNFQKPSGAQLSKAGTVGNDPTAGECRYTIEQGFLDEAGTWTVQGHVYVGSQYLPTNLIQFTVAENLGDD